MKKKRKRKIKLEKFKVTTVNEHLEECLKNPKFKKIYYEGRKELAKEIAKITYQINVGSPILEYTLKENEYCTPFKYWGSASLLGLSQHLYKG